MNAFEKITYLMLETNSSCQLSCLSCNRDRLVQEGKRKEKKLTKDELLFILDKFKNCPIDTIKLEGVFFIPIHRQPVYQGLYLESHFPNANLFADIHLCPPCYPELRLDDVDRVCELFLKLKK